MGEQTADVKHKCLQTLPDVPWWAESPSVRTTVLSPDGTTGSLFICHMGMVTPHGGCWGAWHGRKHFRPLAQPLVAETLPNGWLLGGGHSATPPSSQGAWGCGAGPTGQTHVAETARPRPSPSRWYVMLTLTRYTSASGQSPGDWRLAPAVQLRPGVSVTLNNRHWGLRHKNLRETEVPPGAKA